MKTYKCTCCGSDVTAPYFYGQGVYGWSCIKKVNPAAKKTKNRPIMAEDAREIFNSEKHYVGVYERAFSVKVGGVWYVQKYMKTLEQEPVQSGADWIIPDNHGVLAANIFRHTKKPVPFA